MIEKIHSDNGTEFVNKQFKDLAKLRCIKITTTAPHTPQHNGLCERNIGTLMNMTKVMLESSVYLKEDFWCEAIQYAALINNIMNGALLKSNSNIEFKMSDIHPFGCAVAVLKPIVGKLSPNGEIGYLLRPAQNAYGNAYRIYIPNTNKIIISRNFRIMNTDNNNKNDYITNSNNNNNANDHNIHTNYKDNDAENNTNLLRSVSSDVKSINNNNITDNDTDITNESFSSFVNSSNDNSENIYDSMTSDYSSHDYTRDNTSDSSVSDTDNNNNINSLNKRS